MDALAVIGACALVLGALLIGPYAISRDRSGTPAGWTVDLAGFGFVGLFGGLALLAAMIVWRTVILIQTGA